ncbi:MAG: O-antigen ligase family protein [Chloroflexota bacterium]
MTRRAGLARWADRGTRLALALLVVAMPFRARSDVVARPPEAVSAVLADLVVYAVDVVVVLAIGLWLLARGLDRRRIELGPRALRLLALVIVGLAWLTIPFGVEPAVSVAGAIRITAGAVLALVVLDEVESLAGLAVPVAAMLAIQAAVGIGQAATGGALGLAAIGELPLDPAHAGTSVVTAADGTRYLRAYGLTPHPNVLGGFLACGLVLLLAAPTTSRLARLAQAAVVVVATAGLVVTFSRGAWLAGLAGLVVSLVVLAGIGARPPVRRWLAGAVLVVAVAAAVGWLARDPIASRTWLAPSASATEQRSVDERLEQIRLGWRVVLDRPLTGAGASAVPIAMRQLEPDFEFAFYAPHLVPLAVAGELGIAGGLAYLGLMAAPWVLLASSRRRWTIELAGASAALAALAVVSGFDDYPWVGGPGRTLGWFVLGLWVMAWTRAGRGRPGTAATGIHDG